MEGPTPVSALIHAATMVTAGVYLIVRCNVLYDLAPSASDVVAVIGAVTLLVAATIALVQEDIKRVLAWSTVSQIGYMIMGAGLGAYDAAMFHLLEHAFFKALLFLAVGIVIHALAGRAEPRPDGRAAPPPAASPTWPCWSAAWRSPASRPSRASSARTRSWRPSLEARRARHRRWRSSGLVGGRDHGLLHVPPLLPHLLGTRARGRLRVERRTPRAGRCPLPVVVLAVLASAVGGLIQVPGGWHLIDDWLEPVVPRRTRRWSRRSTGEVAGERRSASRSASIAIAPRLVAVRGRPGAAPAPGGRPAAHPRAARRPVPLRRGLRGGGRPARARPRATSLDAGRGAPGPCRAASWPRRGADSTLGRGLRAAETGLVRSYAFAMVAGAVVVGRRLRPGDAVAGDALGHRHRAPAAAGGALAAGRAGGAGRLGAGAHPRPRAPPGARSVLTAILVGPVRPPTPGRCSSWTTSGGPSGWACRGTSAWTASRSGCCC